MSNNIYKYKNATDELIKVKHRGKIFTPDYLVENILNQGHYINSNINKKHVIDNSCGDGQFMVHIVDRYCKDFLSKSKDLTLLKTELETYIHAIEIEKEELNICIHRCNQVIKIYGLDTVKWDFINGDTLTIHKYNGKMDFVLGNPPYVRVHNLNKNFDSVKGFLFGNGGMTDLYIVFYEIGIKMLNNSGVLCYITPSSFFTSVAGTNMRNYLNSRNLLESICDLKHFQPFDATTYTTIVCINKQKSDNKLDYYEFNEQKLTQVHIETLTNDDYIINNQYFFSTKKKLNFLRKILYNNKESDISIKNGYATLADKVFINNFSFKSKYIIPIVKASRGLWTKIIYPYDKNANFILEDELKKEKSVYNYLLNKKSELLNRDNEKTSNSYWYAFGRSQGLNDTYKDKLSINTLIRQFTDLKIIDVPAGSGVYSGLYIVSSTISTKEIKKALMSNEFETYISLLGKYKSGGYYTFSSKDVKHYLDYKFKEGGGNGTK